MRFYAGGYTDIGRVRAENQDRLLTAIDKDSNLYAFVADGVGSYARSGAAAALACKTALESLLASRVAVRPRRRLHDAMEAANREVHRQYGDRDNRGASTLVLLASVGADKVLLGSAGDSSIFLLRAGSLERLTTPQATGNMLHQSIGQAYPVEPELHLKLAQPGDVFLLCSDGVTNELDAADLVGLLSLPSSSRPSSQRLARQVVGAAVEAGGRDNATAVAVVVW